MNTIGENIKLLRLKQGLYQNQLAEKVGCTQAHISRIEHGKKFSISLLVRFTEELNCKVTDIIK